MTLPWFLPLERFVLRFLVFLDNPYAVVAANCSNADHVLDAMCWNTCWHEKTWPQLKGLRLSILAHR